MKYVSSLLRPIVFGGLSLAGFLFLAGCATGGTGGDGAGSGPGGQVSKQKPLDSNDALRIGEEIVVEFSGVSDPPPRHEERIKVDGRITLPSIGAVQAAGITRGQLEEEIHKRYVPSYFRQLTVIVRNESRFFYVNGQVKNPNRFPYTQEITVLQAIATAGDFTDFAKKTKVVVTRADGRTLDVNCIKAQKNPKLDVPIYPDDRIMVPRRYF